MANKKTQIQCLIGLSIIILVGSLFLPVSVLAQEGDAQDQVDQVTQTQETAAVGEVSLVWRIIQIIAFIGLLASVAGLSYGAVLWRNGTNNNDVILVDRGRRITLVFGLLFFIFLIMLIVSFIVIRRQQAQIAQPPPRALPAGVGGLEIKDALLLIEIIPIGQIPIRNVQVQMIFNQPVSQTAVDQFVTIQKAEDSSVVAGSWEVDDGFVIFKPNQNCPSPHTNLRCFDSDTAYNVVIDSGLTSQDGDSFRCSISTRTEQCLFSFTTGDKIDAEPPQVSITMPFDAEAVPLDSNVTVEGLASDDVSVVAIHFFVDGARVGIANVAGGELFPEFRGAVNWDTSGLLIKSEHALTATVYDMAGLTGDSQLVTVEVLPLYCFDEEQNEDEEGIDCGGPTCRACQGSDCTDNSQCASGLCFDGKCQEFPIIEEVIHDNGAPGNYATIRGRNFNGICGNTGEIYFLGGPGDEDDVLADTPNCENYWSTNEVIIQIPEQAPNGPLKIVNGCGLYDRTDDSKGINLEFEVNDIVRPSLCSVNPSAQIVGEEVQLIGRAFGEVSDDVLFGGISANSIGIWTADTISAVVVPIIEPAEVSVSVVVGEQTSNPVLFTALSSPILPRLASVNPDRGPIGQMFSVQGENLSADTLIKFYDPRTGDITLADTNLPEACQRLKSSSTQRAFRVPRLEPGVYQIFAESDIGRSNNLDFTVNLGDKLPGLCGLIPDNGPVGTEVSLFGEGFGSTQGSVRFNPRIDDTITTSWADDEVAAMVPGLAQSGPVQAIHEGGALSNPLNFSVGECSPDTCETGFECCSTGSCVEAGSCAISVPFCSYSWVFTTGEDLGGPPRVIEDPTCRTNTQSPSPYKDSQAACSNGAISARFTHNMDEQTFSRENIILRKCNTGPNADLSQCQTTLTIADIKTINSGQTGEGFVAVPQLQLESNTWYQVELATGIAADNGLSLAQPYLWAFKTQVGKGVCDVDKVEVTPPASILRQLNEVQNYAGVPTAVNCNILNPESYTWNWLSSDTAKATIIPSQSSETIATSAGPTEPGPPVKIIGEIPVAGISDHGLLTVSLLAPVVVEKWPSCSAACVNAAIGARFDQPMVADSVTNTSLVQLLECADITCARASLTSVGVKSLRYNETDQSLFFLPEGDALKAGASYRVILSKGMRSTSGLTLGGLNYDSDADNAIDSYSWIFSVRKESGLCAVDRVAIIPFVAFSYLVGQDFNYFSIPVSPADACSSDGQMINPELYNWGWASSSTAVGIVSSNDEIPPPGNIDPYQITTSVGQGKTDISAMTQGVRGDGEFNVICGYEDDTACPAPATINTHGVGSDTCCYSRPEIVSVNPADGSQQVCTTLAVQVQFDQLMDVGALITNINLEYNNGTAACPGQQTTTWNKLRNLAGHVWDWIIPTTNAQAENWCQVESSVSVSHNTIGSLAQVYPDAILQNNVQFRIRTSGDPDLTDGVAQGIRNSVGVAMPGEEISIFTTGKAECTLEMVEVVITPPGEAGDKDIFFCAVRNDCPNDINAQAEGNQHSYQAIGRDYSGYAVPATFRWAVTGDPILTLDVTDGDVVEVTDEAENGDATVTVFAKAEAPSKGKAVRSVDVAVFLCENPWPSILDFPYSDNIFNFDLFYCRDFGEPGVQDDLPPLSDPITTLDIGGSLQESLFIID